MREIRTSGLMSGDGRRGEAKWLSYRTHPRLYRQAQLALVSGSIRRTGATERQEWWASAGHCFRHALEPSSAPGCRGFWRATSVNDTCAEGEVA
jgi:hypothetical protein